VLRVGITGGIASGKSTVADMFAVLGVAVIDTDVIAREVVQPGQAALAEIEAEFGSEVISGDGSLDRRALRAIVFDDHHKRQTLEAILHPRIREQASLQALQARGPYLLVVVPLLVESPMKDEVERILVVDCDEHIQLQRLMERDIENEGQARKMIAAQSSRADRLAIADDVIVNDGDLEQTRQQVEALHSIYLRLQSGTR
jgi:dephospho-CoA kinase